MSLRLGTENEGQFRQCVGGPVWDGDVISKDARDRLVENGLLSRAHGYNILTADGVMLAIGLRMLRPGEEGS